VLVTRRRKAGVALADGKGAHSPALSRLPACLPGSRSQGPSGEKPGECRRPGWRGGWLHLGRYTAE
jgi:hypothetical protein